MTRRSISHLMLALHPVARARRTDAIARLGVLERAGDPLLTGITRLAAFIADAEAAAQFELRQIAAELGDAAGHDPLTGAVNRLVLGDRLAQASARHLRREGHLLVAVIDIGAFKQLNDSLGHAAGDEVLVCVAQRLMGSLRAQDTVARVGGDEFVVLAEIAQAAEAAGLVRDRIESILAAPMTVAGRPRQVRVSVGAVLAEPGEDVVRLLGRADAAMYRRKARPRCGVAAARRG